MPETNNAHKRSLPEWTAILLVVLLFAISGIISTFSYVHFAERGGMMLPGVFYTVSTLILFTFLRIPLKWTSFLYYIPWMMLLWLATLGVTAMSSYFAILAGFATSGLSAIGSIVIVNRVIKPVKFDRMKVFFIGALSFVFADILILIYSYTDKTLLEYLLNLEDPLPAAFSESIFFWQLITGITLYKTLRSSANENPDTNHK